MTLFSTATRVTLAVALLVPFGVSLWLMAVPSVMSTSTFAVLMSLLVAVAGVTLNSAHNARATGSLGQMLHETELGESPARARSGQVNRLTGRRS